MPLSSGEQLGHYKILSMIGKGGMGEVYLGTDTRLGRSVAIKVSSREFNDRFEREARAISTLNHPNICTLYDIGPNYLVLELVEGETLSKIIERGPLPLDKALSYAVQIVDALAAAHAKGVIHRDLKPGNIIITKNGAKVLDFGLAKVSPEKISAESAANIQTITEPITRAGAILGTLYYMSPEQVEGKEADERSDIFSFGVVLYEMITGQRPFTGDTQAAVLAALLKDQPPPMSQQPSQRQPAVPRALERVVRKCLEKKPDDRWQSARDLKPTLELIDLDAPPANMSSASASVPIPVQTQRRRWLWPSMAAAVVLVLAAGGTYAYLNREIPVPDAIRFEIGLPGSGDLGGAAVSPDGRKLAFVVRGTDQTTKLWIRSLSTSEARPLDGSEGVAGIPFWSPDSRYVAFGADGKLKKMEAAGGPAQTLATVGATVAGGLWTAEGKIVFGQSGPTRMHQVSASGGTATPISGMKDELVATPSVLPDGKHFVFAGADGIYIASLEDGSQEMPRRILQDSSVVAYTPAPNSKQGYLLFVRGSAGSGVGPPTGTLMAQPFDPRRNELAGDAVPIAENVTAAGGFSVSQTGVLIHSRNAAGGGSSQTGTTGVLTWLDRTGKVLSTVGDLKGYGLNISLSPDGKRVAASHNGDLWVFEFERGVETRLTFEPGGEMAPVWRGDGSRIVYTANAPGGALYEKPANGAGSPELFFTPDKELGNTTATEWTPDGRYLALSSGGGGNGDMWLLPAEGTAQTRKLMPLVKTQFNERGVRFSSSGKFFSYTSDESGRDEAYVRPFDPQTGTSPGGQWMISKGGGISPHWRSDGKEMFYVSRDGAMMSVEIDMKQGFQPGVPTQLFKLPGQIRFWDVTRDGQKFLIPVPVSAANSAPYNVIVNWTSTLKK
jgi:serine/threonine protein kinase/Tol biopolymer transport system component